MGRRGRDREGRRLHGDAAENVGERYGCITADHCRRRRHQFRQFGSSGEKD